MGVWVRVVARVPLLLGVMVGACGGEAASTPADGRRVSTDTGVDTGTGTGTGTGTSIGTGNGTGSMVRTMTMTATFSSCPPRNTTYWCKTSSTNLTLSTVRVEDCTETFPEDEPTPSTNVFTCQPDTPCGPPRSMVCNVLTSEHVSAGMFHACALQAGGSLACWGAGMSGQLGSNDLAAEKAPVQVLLMGGATSVSAGGAHTCATFEGGRVSCWGSDGYGELGASAGGGAVPAPLEVTKLPPAVSVSSGVKKTCAVLQSGHIACWGASPLGDGTGLSSDVPVEVQSIDDALSVSVGYEQSCAVRRDGSVWCWGFNYAGELGDGTLENRETPVQASGVENAVAVACGGEHSCALVADGSVWCWGRNNFGQADPGPGAPELLELPAPVPGLGEGVTAIATGRAHTCAVVNGGVQCWGWNNLGQLGDAVDMQGIHPLASLSDVTDVSAGDEFSCARVASGGVFCWGENNFGQLGNGTLRDSAHPVAVVAR